VELDWEGLLFLLQEQVKVFEPSLKERELRLAPCREQQEMVLLVVPSPMGHR
jgi:hypothetical protein